MPRIACPNCGGVLPLTDAQLDRRIGCGRCGEVFTPRDNEDDYDDRHNPDDLPPRRQASAAGNVAVAGLVLGLVGLVLSVAGFAICCPFFGAPFGALGIVFGVMGRRSEFRGLAVAGIATGTAAVLITVVATVVILVFTVA